MNMQLIATTPGMSELILKGQLAFAHKGIFEWWSTSQEAFTDDFVHWVNSEIAAGEIKGFLLGIGRKWEET